MGVDVFLVISGYLITSIILAESQAGTFTLMGFYERRARRILPALFVVMFACLPFAWLWMLPRQLKQFSDSLVAVSAFGSNIFFWSQSGYFDTANELKPLLHTWSLAVEEQYYLLFPVFLLLIWRLGTRWVVRILIAIAVISLAAAQWGAFNKPAATFYLLPTRGWELLIGALVAFYLFANNDKVKKEGKIAQSLSFIGVFLITCAVFAFDKQTPFPSIYALVPTIGTALVILFANERTTVGNLLGSKYLVAVGLISYSAYLWHYPLFAFARLRSIDEPSKAMFVALAAITLSLAYFSWQYVEAPFRDKRRVRRRKVVLLGFAFASLFTLLGLIGSFNDGFPGRRQLSQFGSIKTYVHSRCHTINRRTVAQLANGDFCVLGAGKTATFAVIGDSHAGAIFEVINAYKTEIPFAFYAISGGFCAPLLNDFRLGELDASDCMDTTKEAFSQLLKSHTIRDVVLFAEWAVYTKGFRVEDYEMPRARLAIDGDGAARSVYENKLVFERSLRKTIEVLKSAGKNVIIVMPVPEFNKSVIATIAKNVLWGESPADIASYAPFISVDEYVTRNAEVIDVLGRLEGVTFVTTVDIFCDGKRCNSIDGKGRILFSDRNHLTEYGAQLVVDRIMTQRNQQ